jgi:hypothetical protein
VEVENKVELKDWQKEMIDERLSDYYKNTADTEDFDKMLGDIEGRL